MAHTLLKALHMEIRFQPALLQEVIDSFVEKTEREGDPTYYKEFHEHADPIYEKFMLEDREAEFKKLYQYLFGIWGFSDIVRFLKKRCKSVASSAADGPLPQWPPHHPDGCSCQQPGPGST